MATVHTSEQAVISRQSRQRGRDRVLILVKALPHAGQRQGETVCCAGVTAEGEWRRQYPIHFRRLRDQFKRWQWIEYEWISPGLKDRRLESRRVQEDSIKVGNIMPPKERAAFLDPIFTNSTADAASRGMSLTIVRPRDVKFRWKLKSISQVSKERAAYESAARQKSFFDADLRALEPCPYAFYFDWSDGDGKAHEGTCDDWETTATYYRRCKVMGEKDALESMENTFGKEYPEKGMAFAMGTHSRRPDQWLLVGVIRIDSLMQPSFL